LQLKDELNEMLRENSRSVRTKISGGAA
jgi:hypothetical protein